LRARDEGDVVEIEQIFLRRGHDVGR
jgi:hypothetical protein